MLGKFNKIFGQKKAGKSVTLSSLLDTINNDEKKAEKDLTEKFQKTEDHFARIFNEITEEIAALKIKEKEEVSHPKLEKIGETALPNFVKSMEHIRVPRFSGNSDEYYEDVTLFLSQYVKAQQGPGKYLHLIFSDEMKRIRRLVGLIGDEVNSMTSALKNRRESRESLKNTKTLIEKFLEASSKDKETKKQIEDIDKLLVDLQNEQKLNEENLSSLHSSKESSEIEDLKKKIENCEQEISLENCRVNAVIHPIITAYRKSRNIISKTGTARVIRSFDDIKDIIEGSPPFDTEKLGKLFDETLPLIQSLAKSGQIHLKGKDEQLIISPDYSIIREISLAQASFIRVTSEISGLKNKINESSTEKDIISLNNAIEKIKREIQELEEKKRKKETEYKEIMDSLPERRKELEKNVKTVFGEETEIIF